MKWIWNYLRKKINEDENYASPTLRGVDRLDAAGPTFGLHSNSLRFNLYRANSGVVVEVQKQGRYNEIDDQTGLYIITDDEDLGDHLSKIVTIEKISR